LKYLPYKSIKGWREKNTPTKCPIFGCKINDAVVDHDHESGYVRGVLHRQSNAWAGKIENAWKRYGANHSKHTLPEALRGLADYLDHAKTDILHPVGLKDLVSRFSRKPKDFQESILEKKFDKEKVFSCKNQKDRTNLYRKSILLDYDNIN
jgi:hypothetical protein|tara:strand:- start:110 stop:562 length:453 start_codon:yes stop_codon:yes gene_type:complete